jgi:putative DNA primase/helicase
MSKKPIDLVIEALERLSQDPKSYGSGNWRSKCPVHNGSSHNLSITETPDGAVLLHCHHAENGSETCSPPAIASRLGLTMKDLFPTKDGLPSKRAAKKARHVPTKGQGKPTADAAIAFLAKQIGQPTNSWIYYELHNGQRFPLMQVYRFDLADGSKQFRPVHVSEDGWRLGDPPGKLPLYNLPEVVPAETVVVVEGEKCCEIVHQLGLAGTTSSHGSKSAAKTDWTPLAGKNVVIIPDNDEAGESYALGVAYILSTLNPKPSIRILRLPVHEKGHDIEEWLKGCVPEQWGLVDARIELERMWAILPEWIRPAEPAKETEAETEEESLFSLTEWGNAKRMVKKFGGRMRYCYPNSKWLIWDGHRWSDDDKGEIWRMAKSTVRHIPMEALESEDTQYRQEILRWAARSEGARTIKSAIELAWSEPGVGVMPDDFDKDDYLLNCPNGVVDLLTGIIRPSKSEDLLSKSTSAKYDPCHPCPQWLAALNLIFDGDQSLIDYLQRACGYSLTGDISEHALFFCYGTGRNGKNMVLDTIRGVLGDPGSSYAAVTDPKLFLAAGQNEHPAGIAALVGKRMVVTSEIDTNQQFAQALVKRLTGETTMTTRFMRGNWFEFTVQYKIWMQANAKPEISGTDEGIWSRIRIIPFDVFIAPEKRVKGLSEILIREEGPGILAWLVEGCRKWKELGLAEPEKVTKAIRDYRTEQDVVGMFLEQCTKSFLSLNLTSNIPRVKSTVLYNRYAEWCEASGERDVLTSRKFGAEMTRRGYALDGKNGGQSRLNVTLCDTSPDTSGDGTGTF